MVPTVSLTLGSGESRETLRKSGSHLEVGIFMGWDDGSCLDWLMHGALVQASAAAAAKLVTSVDWSTGFEGGMVPSGAVGPVTV
mmetsp:Transcript_49681/g.129521  ORF Transcript_49681/g.129521 Transcript_49681/m.129521 type:complete len:84 (+) Transcript_49681:79-330(+)